MKALNFFSKHLIQASRRKKPAAEEFFRHSGSKTVQRTVSEAAVKFFSQQEKTKKEILSQRIDDIEKKFSELKRKGYSGDMIETIEKRLKVIKAKL